MVYFLCTALKRGFGMSWRFRLFSGGTYTCVSLVRWCEGFLTFIFLGFLVKLFNYLMPRKLLLGMGPL